MKIEELMDQYLDYVGRSEAPEVYHRWSFLTCLSAALGRRVHFRMGHFTIYPNLYVMLIGDPGARKSTAINIAKDLLRRSGFNKFAGSQVSRERFYADLDSAGELDLHSISQQFICAPEFNNFLGVGNPGFITALTQLYDAEDEFEAKYKNSKSSIITNPCVGILGGNTQQGFSEVFPPSILHNGFLSRLLLIWGQRTGEKIAYLADADEIKRDALVNHIISIREGINGSLQITPQARDSLKEIYERWQELEDGRFDTYGQRRYIHLLKLSIISAAATGKIVIEYSDVLYANTLLVSAELFFPRALGEFGKAKNANEASVIMNFLYNQQRLGKKVTSGDLWRNVSTNLDKFDTLRDLLIGLCSAGKVIHSEGLYWVDPPPERKLPHVDFKLLGQKALSMIEREMTQPDKLTVVRPVKGTLPNPQDPQEELQI